MKYPYLLFCIFVLAGCAKNGLVENMQSHGITHEITGKIVLRGSEPDVGSKIIVPIREQFIIQEIWDSIYQSRPYSVWYASGYRHLDFYNNENDSKPILTLLVNESGATHIQGTDKRFRCPGLEQYVMNLLTEEYKKQKGEQSEP